MTHRVTFILQEESSSTNRIAFLCTLLTLWYRRGQSCFCLTPDQDYNTYLDDQLWSFSASVFLPHAQGPVSKVHQIHLSNDPDHAAGATTIFNCTQDCLVEFQPDCEHIEFGIASDKNRLRKLYKNYQNQNLSLSFLRM